MVLNIGIIGFGKSTNRYHLPFILNRENLKVKTVYNRSKKVELEGTYKDKDINFTTNIKDLLEDESIKLISICTSSETHYKFAKMCLEHNKNVLVEKPFTKTFDEAKELIDLARNRGLVIMPYQNRRFDSDFLAVKEVVESGVLGELVEIESHFDYYRPEYPTFEGEKTDGAFFGLGVHTIDQIVYLFGKPNKVYYDIRTIRNKENPDDYYHIELFYNKFKAIVKTNHLVKSEYPKFIVHGTKGSFIKYGIDKQEECLKGGIMPWDENFGVDPKENYGILDYINSKGENIIGIKVTPQGDYGRVYDYLYETLINGREKLVKDLELITVMKILEEGIASETPKIVEFK